MKKWLNHRLFFWQKEGAGRGKGVSSCRSNSFEKMRERKERAILGRGWKKILLFWSRNQLLFLDFFSLTPPPPLPH